MGLDEVGTARTLREHRAVTDPLVPKHGGRIVKTTGDGVLLEFPSVVDAVECAVAVQAVMAERNNGVPEDRRMLYRIGINLGDILIEGDDILGDSVNVAARLEGLAEPGSICISSSAYEQVRGKVLVDFTDIGEQRLKNIDRPVRTYTIRSAASLAAATVKSTIEAGQPLPLPDKPSIAVLPFQNMSGDPEQEYFADGMVEDIITALSRFKSLFVIARNSSFTYKGKPVDIKQIGRELGVRYVLEGSVRKVRDRLRITGQLIEAATDRHLWADKFEGAIQDVFELQDQITTSVVGLITGKVSEIEIERAKQKPTNRLDSYDFYLRGHAWMNKRKPLPEGYDCFRKAFELDPEFGAAYAMAAFALMMQQYVSGVPLTAGLRAEAIRLANLGSKIGNDDAGAVARAGQVLAYFGHEFDRGAEMVDLSVRLNPNLAIAWQARGWVNLMCGEPDRALDSFERLMRISPAPAARIGDWAGIAMAQFGLGRYEDGYASALKSTAFVVNTLTLVALIGNAALAGHEAEARRAVAQLLKLQPDFRVSNAEEIILTRSPERRERFKTALRLAGVPE
jgi:adenylate cyclase